MEVLEERDYFTDKSVLLDPYDYFEEFRARGPVVQMQNRDMLFVTGFKETVEVLLNKAGVTGVYFDERGKPMQASAQMRDPAFRARVVAETRALLARETAGAA